MWVLNSSLPYVRCVDLLTVNLWSESVCVPADLTLGAGRTGDRERGSLFRLAGDFLVFLVEEEEAGVSSGSMSWWWLSL